jgi:beta-glucanase (GH16 family)
MVQMYVDDWRKPFLIRTASDVPAEGRWVFNAPFYFILNLAVGGDWPGPPNSATPNPSEMVVDYVRVYKANRIVGPTMTASPLKAQPNAASSTILHLTPSARSGYVYLACSAEIAKAICSVDTGNALNASVVDFSTSDSQTAQITVSSSAKGDVRGDSHVTVTAYTVSGEQSSIVIPIAMN